MAEHGEPLSDRELDVLKRLAAGESNKAIADGLSISPYTVKTHLRNIYSKLGVSTRTEAMTVALQQGVLTVPGGVDAPHEEAPDVAARPVAAVAVPSNGATPAVFPPAAPAAPGAHAHRWRTLSLALLALLLLTAAAFAFVQWREGVFTPPAAPYVEQPLGETRWLSSRPLAEGRAGRAAAAVGLDVYAIGGETASGASGAVSVFDTKAREWRMAADKPTAVTEATAAELFGEIYVPGGALADGQPTAIVEAYSPAQDAWRRVASLPEPVAGGLAVADAGFLYLIGGRNAAGALPAVYLYDPGADSWRPLAPLPAARAAAAGGALTGRLYVVGGTDGTAAQRSCFIYDPPADTWDTCPDMIRPRVDAGATVLLNKLYVIGGTLGDEPGNGEVYDPNSRAWTVLNAPPDITAWSAPGVTHVETRIYALGGRRGDALSDATLVYAPLAFQTFIPAAPSDAEE